MSPRRVRVFTGGDDDYVYQGTIFDKRHKRVEERPWIGTARQPDATLSHAKRLLVLSPAGWAVLWFSEYVGP